ncbi:unnamed protein product [Choristocarpus tenellus]
MVGSRVVQQWLAKGLILHPLGDMNSVDLTRGISLLAGVSAEVATKRWTDGRIPQAMELAEVVGHGEHISLVILDGLGMNILEKHLPQDSFLRRNFRRSLRSVFPATTTAGITALTTGDFPSHHGLLGWTVKCNGRLINPLPYSEEGSMASLGELGLDMGEVFAGVESSFGMSTRKAKVAFSRYAKTPYTSISTKGMAKQQCETTACTMDALGSFWRETYKVNETSFCYVYIPEPDHTEHCVGFDHEDVGHVLRDLDAELSRLWESTSDIPGRKQMIITADHGHRVVAPTEQLVLGEDPSDTLLQECLLHPPTVEPRSPCFHCRPGLQDEFAARFRASRFAADFELLSTDEVEDLQLLGPGNLSPVARERVGDFQAFTAGPKILVSGQPRRMIGWHGGATPVEMEVPLIVVE